MKNYTIRKLLLLMPFLALAIIAYPSNCPDALSVTITGSDTGCASVSLTAVGSGVTGALTYSWSGGSHTGSAANTFTSSNTYTVTITDTAGCSKTASADVVINSNPSAHITGSTSGCSPISLTATGGTTYAWSGGNNTSSATNDVTSTGTYTVTVTDSHQCTATASVNETVLSTPSALITPGGPSNFCPNGSVLLTAPSSGNALNFSGGEVTAQPSAVLGTGPFTIEAWIFPTDTAAGTIVAQQGSGSSFSFKINTNGAGSLSFVVNGVDSVTTTGGLIQNQWQHVAVSVTRGASGNLTKLYVDGVAVDSGNIVNTTLSDTALSIGSSTGAAFSGAMDELRVWNTALGQIEIKSSMYSVVPSNSPNLADYYRFDEGTGTTAADLTGNATGTLSGNVSWQTPSSAPVAETGNTLLYNWSTGSLAQATEATSGGSYSVIVTNTTSNCTAGATFMVTQDTSPVAIIDTVAPLCAGSTLYLNGQGGNSYKWSGPNGFTSTEHDPGLANITTAAYGEYSLTVTNSNNCTGSAYRLVTVYAQPSLSDTSITRCVGSTITLSAPSGNLSYSWSGPGLSSSLQDPVITNVTTAATGTYTVTATNYFGCSASATTALIIDTLPVPTAGSNEPCVGSALNLTSGPSGETSYSWSGPGGYASLSQNPTIGSASTANIGTYTVTVTNSGGCSATATVLVTLNAPAVTAGSNSPLCVGSTLNLTSGPVGETSYAWSGPNSFSSSSQDTSISNADSTIAGTYTVTVTNDSGCSATATVSVSVNNPVAAPSASNSGPICAGSSLTLSANTANSYSWSGPNGFSSTQQDPEIGITSAADSGVYTVTVTTNGCSATATTTASVKTVPVATDSNSTTGTTCAGENISLFANGGGTYQWSGPLGFSTAQQNPTISDAGAAATGIYTVTVTAANGCTASAATSLTIIDVPAVAIAGLNDTVCTGETLDLSADGGISYSWTGPNGFISHKQDTVISHVTTAAAGTYTVSATNAGGCSANASTTITVNVLPTITFCPGNMTVNATNGLCGAAVSFAATATGTPVPAIWYSQNPGTVFPVGTTSILVTAYNTCGSVTCNFTVTVVDSQPPAFACPSNIAVLANESTDTKTLVINTPIVTDNCGVASILNSFNGTSNAGGTYPAGTTYIVWTATDVNGNTSSCTQTVTIYPNLVVSGTVANTLCPGTFFGSVTTLVAGGQLPYGYAWSNASTSANLSNLAAGNYTVTVTDGAHDVVTETFTVETIIPASAPNAPGPISGPAYLCAGATGTYAIAAVPNTVSYNWTVPNNAVILSGQGSTQITVQFPTQQSFGNVQVAAVNCVGTSNGNPQLMVSAITTPAQPGAIQGSASVCAAGSVYQYSVSSPPPPPPPPGAPGYPVTYNWTAPANASVQSGQGTNVVTIKFSAGFSTGNISVTASDCAGSSSSQSLKVSVSTQGPGALNDIDFYPSLGEPDAGVCPGDTLSFTVMNDNPTPNISSFNWTAPANSAIIAGQGTQVVTLVFRAGYNGGNISVSGSNCIGSGGAAVQSLPILNQAPGNPNNPTSVVGNANQNTGCPGDTLAYTINPVNNAMSYTWTVPANTILVSGQGTTTVKFVVQPAFSSGNLSVYASNCAGNSQAGVQFIDIADLPGSPGNIQGPAAVCPGIIYNYNANAANGEVETYVWTAPAGATIVSGQGTTSAAVIYQNGFAGGTLNISASNCIGSTPSSLSVNPQGQVPSNPNINAPNPPPGPPPPPPGQFNECVGDTAIYTTPWANGATSYTWAVSAHETIISGQGSTTVAVAFNSGFTGGAVIVYASNCFGNSNTANANITHNNCGSHGTTGIDVDNGLSNFNALVYPNPFTDQFNLKITTDENEPVDLKIFDITGKLVDESSNIPYQEEIAVGNKLQSGIYLVQVKQGDNSKVLRIVKTE